MRDPGRIEVLPQDAAERIAAGEVIERPASVIKELVENSLDAGATRITVEVEAAGLRLIRVTDDGEGIAAGDLPRAFQRFATSKIRNAADLERIETYGFRGEALPSIAAVARVEVLTSVRGGQAARLRIEGGRAGAMDPAAGPPGTTMQVRALFFNTPARRKFLKSPARELGVLVETLQGLALAAPEVAFRLSSDGRELLWYPAERFGERARRVLGPGIVPALDLQAQLSGGSLEAVLGTPQSAQPRRTHQWFLINRRPVRSPMLARALSHAYHTLVPEDRHPAAVLAVQLPAGQVDANVHPRKTEVRFAQEVRIFEEVVREVGGALRRAALVHVVGAGLSPATSAAAAADVRPPARAATPTRDTAFGARPGSRKRQSRRRCPWTPAASGRGFGCWGSSRSRISSVNQGRTCC